jgi:serine O-acetyltransferase
MTLSDLKTSLDRHELARYVRAQLDTFFPDGGSTALVPLALDEALEHLAPSIQAVKLWTSGCFDHLHSSQYCMFLYWLARGIWLREADRPLCNKLFGLNKALNGIDLFYEIAMPDIFFIGHSAGIVLAKATYGSHLVLYQNCTVGKNHGRAPQLGAGVILFPHAVVLGGARIGDRSVMAQGSTVIDREIPPHSLVFRSCSPEPVVRRCTRPYLDDYFHL